jgi:hypothetical protein
MSRIPRNGKVEYDFERIITNLIDQKMKRAKHDLSSLILSASNKEHNRKITAIGGDMFGASQNQIFGNLGAVIQRNILRNL